MRRQLGMLKSVSKGLYKIARFRAGRRFNRPAYPKFISAAVTWRCNSRCATCGIWQAPLQKTDETPPEVYRDNVFQDPLVKQLQTWEMTGGEPMLYDGIFDLTEMAFDMLPKRCQVRIGTNCISQRRLAEYIDHFRTKPLYLSLSIDGIGSKHDAIRGVEGNFQSVRLIIELIKGLQSIGSPIQFGASVCVSRLNLEHIPDLTAWLKTEEIPFQLTPVIFPEYAQSDYARRSREELDFIEDVDRKRAIEIFSQYERDSYPIFCDYWARREYPTPPCYAMREFIHLRPDGNVETCMWLNRVFGNIRDDTLTNIWTSNRADAMRKQLRDCVECNKVHPNLCDSLNNYHFHGTLQMRSWRRRLGIGK